MFKWQGILLLLAFASSGFCQNPGYLTEEQHPPLTISVCDENGCVTENNAVVLDQDWRYVYSVADEAPCQVGNGWDSNYCPDPVTCAQNCALDGLTLAKYAESYGVTTDGNAIRLNYLTNSPDGFTVVGSRNMLVDLNDEYRMFYLKNREFTADIDNSMLECGMDASLYFVEMEKDGGMASYPTNKAGPKYGTGYCDAQCFHYYKFVGGEANINGDPPMGVCCVEMDIWEGNSQAQVLTTHGCNIEGYHLCQRPDECGDNDRYGGVCDKDGAGYNPYKLLQRDFFGEGSSFTIDSSKPVTVVTQFLTTDGTDSGDLSEIRRIYVQDGVEIANAKVGYSEIGDYDSITDDYVTSYKGFFGEVNDFAAKGSLKQLGESLDRGWVLTMSLWDDAEGHMLWMDGVYPPGADPEEPGAANGPCPADSGNPDDMHQLYPDAYVIYSNMKIGTIGSTYTLKKDE